MTGSILYGVVWAAALKSFAVLALAWVVASVFRKQSAAVRHLVWAAAFGALMLLPVLSGILPQLRVAPLPGFLEPSISFQVSATAIDRPAATPEPVSGSAVVVRRMNWPGMLIALWAVGFLVSLARMAASFVKVGRLRRDAEPVDETEWRQLAHLLGIDTVEVLRIPSAITPMAVGVLRPAILIPSDAAEWTAERRRVVLLHELAHVRRRDPAVHMAARLALCLYWWNPAAWAAWRELLKERERAADDVVLAGGSRASDYAAHLLEIARSMRDVPGIASTAICMARKSQLEGRLLAILDDSRRRSIPGAVTAIAAMALAIAVTVPLAAVSAQDTAPNPTGAASLIESADSVRRTERLAEAEARYREAASRIGDRPEAAPAFIGLGITALARQDPAHAIEHFETAQRLDPANNGTALMWLGIAETRRDNASQAEAYYRSALSRLDPNSAQAATVMELCAALLQAQQRETEAKDLVDRASAVRNALGSQAGPQPDASKSVYRAGVDGVVAPKLLHKIEPEYSQEAKIAKYQGTAVLLINIDPDGTPRNVRVVHGVGLGLADKAVEAVSQWRFKPGEKDGQPVPVAAHIEINFRLK